MDAISDMTNVAEHMYAKLLAMYGHCIVSDDHTYGLAWMYIIINLYSSEHIV